MRSQRLVVLRHGESIWNVEQRFTGSTDVALTERGIGQARAAGARLRDEGKRFDLIFTSMLERARHTAREALRAMGLEDIEVRATPRLNERNFGLLEGLKFVDAAAKYGAEWGKPWLYGKTPPEGESLEDVVARLNPFLDGELTAALKTGRAVMVVAHGNTIRAMDALLTSGAEAGLETVPQATPIEYHFPEGELRLARRS